MIDRVRGWSDRFMNALAGEIHGLEWRAFDVRLGLRAFLRKPWLSAHAREVLRMIRTLELCERYGW
jgi:hypothetical protein